MFLATEQAGSMAGRAAEAGRQGLIYVLSLCQRVLFK